MNRPKTLLALASTLFLAGCGAGEPAGPSALRQSCGSDVNLMVNGGFVREEDGTLQPWRAGQHAGENSFRYDVADGVLTIERIASQPWYYFVQDIDVSELKGHRLYYSADLKLNLSGEGYNEVWEPGGGLHVLIWGLVGPAIAGSRQIFNSTFEHEPHIGTTDWFTPEISFVVPDNASAMKVGFEQRADGSMAARNPVLLDCGPAEAGTEATPDA